jgi:aminoglycoside phosphotransferase (APT) family kinase protein
MFSETEIARLSSWLADHVDHPVAEVEVTRLAGGHSSGAWRLDVAGAATPARSFVLKAPELPSVVHRRDACREGRILEALGRMGAPVPAVLGVDDGTSALGRAFFVMEHVDGRSLADVPPGSYHDDPWLRGAGADTQRAVWESFHDALAAMHSVDAAKVPDASLGPNGVADVLAYWRESLLDAAPAAAVPRQLALLDWLGENVPPGADDAPAVCMGDARMVNCLLTGTDVRALVDFEVAYTGNPAADIGYSLFVDGRHRDGTDRSLPGLPSAEETWARWERATGRTADHREYWTAFGATIIVVTATRAMIQWGLPVESVDTGNPLVDAWEAAVRRAAQH